MISVFYHIFLILNALITFSAKAGWAGMFTPISTEDIGVQVLQHLAHHDPNAFIAVHLRSK
ncbi:hypothetical protein VspSTUT11_00770 [Vibrio sp. STUT-A11]|nr:hypothetical protein VspSTUT11_00770 [Vibrio sp. STUT-A11]